jgi:predicted O-methyltransferase YrrM
MKIRFLNRAYRSARGLVVGTGKAKALRAAQVELDRLAAIRDPAAERLVRALRHARSGELAEGRSIIEAIERKREELLRRTDPLVSRSDVEPGKFDLGRTVAGVCAKSKPRAQATLLHLLIREFKPVSALELGTNIGISAAYQAAALEMNGRGHLTTLEVSAFRAELAKELHRSLGLGNVSYTVGLFADTLSGVLANSAPVDYAFLDGQHKMQPTLDYFEQIYGHASDAALVVVDDIRWSSGMAQAWAQLADDPRVAFAIDCWSLGLCVTTRSPFAEHRDKSFLIPV